MRWPAAFSDLSANIGAPFFSSFRRCVVATDTRVAAEELRKQARSIIKHISIDVASRMSASVSVRVGTVRYVRRFIVVDEIKVDSEEGKVGRSPVDIRTC